MTPAFLWTDFGGVLTPPVSEDFAKIVRISGIPSDVLRSAIDAVGFAPLELGLVTEQDWGRQVTARLEPQWTPAIDLGRFGDYWYADRPPNRELIDELALMNVRIGLLSNNVREWERHWRPLVGDSLDFDAVIVSCEVGMRKPDDGIFALAESVAGCRPDQCVLIDDSPANVSAAGRRGWVAIQHLSTATTVDRLRQIFRY